MVWIHNSWAWNVSNYRCHVTIPSLLWLEYWYYHIISACVIFFVTMWCSCDTHVIPLWYSCVTMWYSCDTHVMLMWYLCDTLVIFMCCPCDAHVIPMWCSYDLPPFPQCLLVQGYPASTSWGFPKGKLEKGENDRDTAVREVRDTTCVAVVDQVL